MFISIEGKIKELAKLIIWIGMIISIIIGIVTIVTGVKMNEDSWNNSGTIVIWSGIGYMILGSLLSWVSSFVLYGFGKLIEYAKIIAENTKPK